MIFCFLFPVSCFLSSLSQGGDNMPQDMPRTWHVVDNTPENREKKELKGTTPLRGGSSGRPPPRPVFALEFSNLPLFYNEIDT